VLFKERGGWFGLVTVTAVDPDGHVTFKETFKNHITDAGLSMFADLAAGVITDGRVRYIATGTGTATTQDSDVKLGAEVFRKGFSSQTRPATGQMYTQALIASGESNVNIQELGWFAGVGATATPNSGIMVARLLFSYNKTINESLYLDRTDSIIRG
jgi:hypothetical protein